MPPARRRLVLLLLLAPAGAALAPPTAGAVVRSSEVTTPADPAFLLIDASQPAGSVEVAGTADGAPGDVVDLSCDGGNPDSPYVKDVPVIDGRFRALMPDERLGGPCTLRAVPPRFAGADRTAFRGPMLSVTGYQPQHETARVRGGGPDRTRSFGVSSGHRKGYVEIQTVGYLGIRRISGTVPGTLDVFGDETWSYAARITGFAEAYGRPGLTVDGRPAYTAYGTPQFDYDGAGPLPIQAPAGYQGLTSSVALDPDSGAVTIVEEQELVRCPGSTTVLPPPTADQCRDVAPTGVRLRRTVRLTDDHAVTDVVDRWTSTDGVPHHVAVEYETSAAYESTPGAPAWRFPGEDRPTTRGADDAVAPAGPGHAVMRSTHGTGVSVAPGTWAWDPAPGAVTFGGSRGEETHSRYAVVVPATGPALVRNVLTVALDPADADRQGRAVFPPPSFPEPPAPPAPPADVPPAGDGGGGGTGGPGPGPGPGGGGAGAVKPPPAPCRVPRVRTGSTVTAARKALRKGHCVPARTTRSVRSTTVRRGRVVRISRKAGTTLKAGTTVTITLSAGRPTRRGRGGSA